MTQCDTKHGTCVTACGTPPTEEAALQTYNTCLERCNENEDGCQTDCRDDEEECKREAEERECDYLSSDRLNIDQIKWMCRHCNEGRL